MKEKMEMNISSSLITNRPLCCNNKISFNNGVPSSSAVVIAPAAGHESSTCSLMSDSGGFATTIKPDVDHHHEQQMLHQPEAEHPDADVASSASFQSEEDGIEVFKFDRNSLKLRCEKISPKQLRANGVSLEIVKSEAKVKTVLLKTEKCNIGKTSASSSSSNSDSSSSSSGSESGTELSSSSSSTSNGSSSSSSASSKSSSSSSNCESSSSSEDSSSSSSDNTSETEGSDFEDELKKRRKVSKASKSRCNQWTKAVNIEENKPDLTNGTGTAKMSNFPKPSRSKTVAHVKQEVTTKDNEILKVEPNVEDLEQKINIEDLMEERRKQRKNSRWGDYVDVGARKSSRLAPKASFCNKNYEAQINKRLRALLKKKPSEWTDDDRTTIQSFPKLVSEVEKRLQRKEVASERLKESEDPPDILDKKCAQLASVISRARYLIIYTGAGISTSAKIPDYRGPKGIWTLLQKGEEVTQSLTDISQIADPTLTHKAIKTLWDRGVAKHIVSQNVDGLHLRSGIPKTALSEVHGNMYVEVCVKCGREFVRLFDVTENTRRHHHKTGRFCYYCGTSLKDSVVLFGEKGSLRWPLNWAGAEYHVDKADVILCLGSSLKVLRRYPWLWSMSQPAAKRPKLYIVNLQWTPKDQFAKLKINGKCDEVMKKVMSHLTIPIPTYERRTDTIFTVATPLHPLECDTKSSTELIYPSDLPYPEKNKDLRNYIRFEPTFKVPIPYENGESKTTDLKGKKADESPVANEGEQEVDNCIPQKFKKRILKGNNGGWLGNAVNFKQGKKRKLK